MPRREPPFLPDQYYHFYNRGNNRQAVFFERDNYLYFLRGIQKYLCGSMEILAYCLMPTHYHLLVRVKPQPRQPQTSEFSENSEVSAAASSAAVSTAMMRLGVSYTKAINKRFGRVGALFQGQFRGKPVQNYEHLLTLCVYIHANPVKDGLVDLPEDWEFSNYLDWIGLRSGTLLNREFIQEHFGSPAEYKSLVLDYLRSRSLPEDIGKYLQDLEENTPEFFKKTVCFCSSLISTNDRADPDKNGFSGISPLPSPRHRR
jgi:putative transposase